MIRTRFLPALLLLAIVAAAACAIAADASGPLLAATLPVR